MRNRSLLAGGLLLLLALTTAAQTTTRPNIVFFYVDDMGWRDVGFMGSRFYETPTMDRLASEGMVFRSAYSNGPNCAPSRACLMSGQYTPRHGVYTVGNANRGKARFRKLIPIKNKTVLEKSVVTMAESLLAAGYATATMGKWHLGADPLQQGFQVNVGGNRRGAPRSYFSPYRNPQLKDGDEGEYLTDRLTEEALDFIAAHKKKPFFLYLTHYAVHTPIQAKKELADRYRKKKADRGQKNPKYAGMIESVDQSLARILGALKQHGLEKNTLVCFYSDNGGHGVVTSMAPLKGSKGMLYEGGIRVPMVMRWPEHIKPGVSDTPVTGVDFYPTFLELAGAKPPKGQVLDGKSLMPLLGDGNAQKDRALFWHFPAYLQRSAKKGAPFRTRPAGAVRIGPWKLIEFFEDGRLELYNLDDDIGETRELSAKHPERTKQLHEALVQWREGIGAPVPKELNPEYNAEADAKARKGASQPN